MIRCLSYNSCEGDCFTCEATIQCSECGVVRDHPVPSAEVRHNRGPVLPSTVWVLPYTGPVLCGCCHTLAQYCVGAAIHWPSTVRVLPYAGPVLCGCCHTLAQYCAGAPIHWPSTVWVLPYTGPVLCGCSHTLAGEAYIVLRMWLILWSTHSLGTTSPQSIFGSML